MVSERILSVLVWAALATEHAGNEGASNLQEAPTKAGNALVMVKCSTAEEDPLGLQEWGACTGTACFASGAFDSEGRTAIRNSPSGLCVDAGGGFPGWAARVMPCATTFDPWFWGNNPITSATWRLTSDGTLRTNISRAGALNASGEVCLFSSLPGDTSITSDWWTSGHVGMWWCNGAPESKWKNTFDGKVNRLRALGGRTAGLCLSSTSAPLPTPKPPVPADPTPVTVSCPEGCLSSPCNGFPYCNATLSPQARAEDFVSRLTLQEKANIVMFSAPAHVPRLGSPAMQIGEAQHGLLKLCIGPDGHTCDSSDTERCRCSTSFPSLVGVGASFNRSLFEAMGEVMGDEARAFFNVLEGNTNLLFWAPSINLARNPLWGRNQETPGEDPLVNGVYGEAAISGLQGGTLADDWSNPHAAPLKAAATVKHYIAYDVECTTGGREFLTDGDFSGDTPIQKMFNCPAPGVDRFHFEGFLSDSDLNDYYLAVFKRPLANVRPAGIMCSFPSINGVPSCANGLMQNTLARGTWGFDGFIVSDCGGINFLNQGHYLTSSAPEAVAAAIKNGVDAEIGIPGPWGHGNYFATHMNRTVERKLLNESELDLSAIRVWRTAFRMGLFEPFDQRHWAHLGFDAIDSARNQQVALEAALQSMVLLKNKDKLLPISLSSVRTLAVVGPFQNATIEMQGGYSGKNIRIRAHSPGQILAERVRAHNDATSVAAGASAQTSLLWAAGAQNGANDTSHIEAAVDVVQRADVALLFVGDTHVAEFSDRTDNGLEASQELLLEAVCATKVPTVVIVIAGHSIELSHAKAHCGAILFAFLPSQFGGDAIIDTVLGVHSPAGRLPVTFYSRSIMTERDPADMSLRGGSGITYQHYRGTPIWEFGFGLSYTSFEFYWTDVSGQLHRRVSGDAVASGSLLLTYSVTVRNTGPRASSVAVLAFLNATYLGTSVDGKVPTPPLRELFNFTRVWLDAGASTVVEFALEPSILANSDDTGVQAVRPGQYTIAIGGVGRAGRVEDGAVSTTLHVTGEPSPLFSMLALREKHKSAEHLMPHNPTIAESRLPSSTRISEPFQTYV